MKGENQNRGTRIRRLIGLSSGGGLAALAVVMLVAPVTLGSVQVAPFKGWAVTNSVSMSQGSCAKAKMLKFPNFSPKTGIGHFSGLVKAPSCTGYPSTNSASFFPSISMTKTFTQKKNHTVTFQFNWSFTYSASWSMTPFSSCALNYRAAFSICYTTATAQIFGFTYIYEPANFSNFWFGQSLFLGNYTYVENYSQNYNGAHYGGNFSHGSSGSFAGTVLANDSVSAPLIKGHSYVMYNYLFGELFASAYVQSATATGAASAAATMNVASLGNQVVLTAIWIT